MFAYALPSTPEEASDLNGGETVEARSFVSRWVLLKHSLMTGDSIFSETGTRGLVNPAGVVQNSILPEGRDLPVVSQAESDPF